MFRCVCVCACIFVCVYMWACVYVCVSKCVCMDSKRASLIAFIKLFFFCTSTLCITLTWILLAFSLYQLSYSQSEIIRKRRIEPFDIFDQIIFKNDLVYFPLFNVWLSKSHWRLASIKDGKWRINLWKWYDLVEL